MPNFVMRLFFLLTENGRDTRKEAAELAINPGMPVLGVEPADSDFAELTLFDKNCTPADTMFLGEPYFDEVP